MTRVVPTREQGHLIVAGVRLLRHRQGRPPLLEEMAELIEMPAEQARVLVSELEERGILRLLTNAFETRLAVDEYLQLEALPLEADTAALTDEVQQFRQAFNQKQDAIKKTFGADALQKKADDKMSRMADELKRFREKGGTGRAPRVTDDKTYPYEDND